MSNAPSAVATSRRSRMSLRDWVWFSYGSTLILIALGLLLFVSNAVAWQAMPWLGGAFVVGMIGWMVWMLVDDASYGRRYREEQAQADKAERATIKAAEQQRIALFEARDAYAAALRHMGGHVTECHDRHNVTAFLVDHDFNQRISVQVEINALLVVCRGRAAQSVAEQAARDIAHLAVTPVIIREDKDETGDTA